VGFLRGILDWLGFDQKQPTRRETLRIRKECQAAPELQANCDQAGVPAEPSFKSPASNNDQVHKAVPPLTTGRDERRALGRGPSVVIGCVRCRRNLRVPETALDKSIRCPCCATIFKIRRKAAQPIDTPPVAIERSAESRLSATMPPANVHERPAPAVPSLGSPQPGRSAGIRITVGFDFGTHSTKVLYRKHGETTSHVLRLDEPCPEYPVFASPSLVQLAGGQLWFGSEAIRRSGGHLYHSLKVRLLGPDRERFLEPLPPGPTPQLLVAAYLAWAFQKTRESLRAEFGAHSVRFNLAAPMNHLQNEMLRDVYLHIVQAAWEVVFGESVMDVNQGIGLDALQARLTRNLDRRLCEESERHFAVLPETIAPIVSMSVNPRVASGIYLILDMGGGTTEISVNKVGKSEAGHHIHCYFDDLIHVGGIDFASLANKEPAVAVAERKKLLDRTSGALKNVWHKGFMKDKNGPRSTREQWKHLQVLLSGGGTRHPEVAVRIESASPLVHIFPAEQDQCDYGVDRYAPGDIALNGLGGSGGIDLSLLGVAHGLALEAQRWPELLKPVELRAFDARSRLEAPEPYWYVGGK
jgi:hypothetical protein